MIVIQQRDQGMTAVLVRGRLSFLDRVFTLLVVLNTENQLTDSRFF